MRRRQYVQMYTNMQTHTYLQSRLHIRDKRTPSYQFSSCIPAFYSTVRHEMIVRSVFK